MQIKRKMEIGFGVVIGMLVAVTGLSAWSLNRSQRATAHLESTFGQQIELAQLLTITSRQMKELAEYVMLNDEDELAEFRAAGQTALTAFDRWKQLIVDELDFVPEGHRAEELKELEVLNRCKTQYLDLMDISREIIELTQQGQSEEALELLEYRVEAAYDKGLEGTIKKQLHDEQREVAALQEAIRQLHDFARSLTIGLAVFTLIGAGLAARIVTRAIAQPLGRLREAAVQIGRGQLDTEINIPARDDIGELAATLNQMARDLKQTTASIDDLQREVSQREKAEANLETINEELTHFAYVVSHDLKAPLRGIKLVADWLYTDYADQFGAEARENFDLLKSRVERMHNLIDGVLQYSRVGRVREDRSDIDLNDLVANAIDGVAPPEHITITVDGPLPIVHGEATRLGQVFQNLLSNAVKYMDKPAGRIIVACADMGDAWKFSVSDNGPGIEPQHFDRIFMIFQTLTRRDEYESTGVGLTLVKKIVELYGGTIWVESEVGKGSTFCFTFPKRPAVPRNDTPPAEAAPHHDRAGEAVGSSKERPPQ